MLIVSVVIVLEIESDIITDRQTECIIFIVKSPSDHESLVNVQLL